MIIEYYLLSFIFSIHAFTDSEATFEASSLSRFTPRYYHPHSHRLHKNNNDNNINKEDKI